MKHPFKQIKIVLVTFISMVSLFVYPQTSYVRDNIQARRAVVKIIAKKKFGSKKTEIGTGVFLGIRENRINIITAYHVVEEADIQVRFKDFPTKDYDAEFIKADEDHDIALISILAWNELEDILLPFKTRGLSGNDELKYGCSLIKAFDGKIHEQYLNFYNISESRGALVVAKTPYATTPIEVGDLLLEVNGRLITDLNVYTSVISNTPENATIKIKVIRNGSVMILETKKNSNPKCSATDLFSLGHARGQDWILNFGWLYKYSDQKYLVTSDLVHEGVSGGPLFDDHWNLCGIITGKNDQNFGEVVDIKDVTFFMDKIRLTTDPWLYESFCTNLKKILRCSLKEHSATELKVGAGRYCSSPLYYWEWDSRVNLSGDKSDKIYQEDQYLKKNLEFVSILANKVYRNSEESYTLVKDITETILECLGDDKGYVDTGSGGLGRTDEVKISFKKERGLVFMEYGYIYIKNYFDTIELKIDITN